MNLFGVAKGISAMSHVLVFATFAVLVAMAASFGAMFEPGPWYAGLTKPSWTPPNWLFGPVWGILYIMIAIAGYRSWGAAGLTAPTIIWGIALALNAAWSYIMFGAHQIGWAFVDISALWLMIVAFIIVVWPLDKWAALLFVPYLVWVSYAAALNYAIWQLNA
jgi:translocator protein